MNAKNTTLNIWMVEDSEVYRNSIEQVIDATDDLRLTANFANCETLLKKHTFFSDTDYPNVLLLDITFERKGRKEFMTGIEGISKIKEALPQIPVVMLTNHDATDFIFEALQNGASGYLHKSSSSKDITDAIRMASRGGMIIPPAVASKVLFMFRDVDVDSEKALTKREMEVIELMARGKSRRQIAEDLFISPNTVDSHLNKIYHNLHVSTGTEAVAKIYGARTPFRPNA